MSSEQLSMNVLDVSHDDLVAIGCRWLRNSIGCGVVVTELVSYANETADVLGWKESTSILIECKTSLSDFRADAKKPFRQRPDSGVGEHRFFLTPRGLLSDVELPEGWGLLEWDGRQVRRSRAVFKGNVVPSAVFDPNRRAETTILCSIARRLIDGDKNARTYCASQRTRRAEKLTTPN